MSAVGDHIPAYIRAGIVIDVNPNEWRMRVRSPSGKKIWNDVPIPSLYYHGSEGEGIHFMPEVGATCWMCEPSEGDTRAFPILFRAPADGNGGWCANRPALNPGDIVMLTRDGNFLKLRRGGVVEIASTPVARTMWIPTSNRILTICENWDLQHFGGSLRWLTSRPEADPDGKKGTQVDWKIKEFADDVSYIARLRMGGQVDEENKPVIDLRVYKDGLYKEDDTTKLTSEDDLTQAVAISVQKTGDVTLETIGNVDIVVAADKHVRVRTTDGKEQMVILGEAFLTQLSKSLTELMAAATAIGMPTTETAKIIAGIATSLSGDGATYLSTRLRTE